MATDSCSVLLAGSGTPKPSPTSDAAARAVPRSGTSLRNHDSTNPSTATGTTDRKTTWVACAYASTIGAIFAAG